jgi:hypothetical protein
MNTLTRDCTKKNLSEVEWNVLVHHPSLKLTTEHPRFRGNVKALNI